MNKLLLDTCVLLWLQLDPSQVPASILRMVTDPHNELYVSAASTWEIVLKWTAGKLKLPCHPAEFVVKARTLSSLDMLPIGEPAVLQASKLPLLHRDPFDRILIGQSIEHGMMLVTPDRLIHQYAVRAIWG